MNVHVDADPCAGFGICVGICLEVFELHEDGYASVLLGEVPLELEDLVRRAASQCPAQAISINVRRVLNSAKIEADGQRVE